MFSLEEEERGEAVSLRSTEVKMYRRDRLLEKCLFLLGKKYQSNQRIKM